jgi:hypothetical protein
MSFSFDSQTTPKGQMKSWNMSGKTTIRFSTGQVPDHSEIVRSNDEFRTPDQRWGTKLKNCCAVSSFISLKSPTQVSISDTANSKAVYGISSINKLSRIQMSQGSQYQPKTNSSIEVESPLIERTSAAESQAVKTQQIFFLLKFLPKYITEEEVFFKISRFGEPIFFHFLVGENSVLSKATFDDTSTKTGELVTKVSRQALFSFRTNDSVSMFASLNRIRIKTLQVKITKITYAQAQETVAMSIAQRLEPNKKKPSSHQREGLRSEPVYSKETALVPTFTFHCIKPTGKLYFALRPENSPLLYLKDRNGEDSGACKYIYRVRAGKGSIRMDC